jgi:pimeloyl-ACP methyl ester carboxylesterase
VRRGSGGWSEERTLLTADGIALSAVHRPPVHDDGPSVAYVLAHGFTGTWRSAGLTRVAGVLARSGGVLAFDFRGHGRSSGRTTVGDQEVLDVDAAVAWARVLGYDAVATVGFSMGASIVVRHAALLRGVDAVVAVSGPARWYYKGTPAMRRLHLVVERRAGRVFARYALGTRIAFGWDPVPEEPRAVAGAIAPTPLLVVHGDRDEFFPVDHAVELADAGGPTAELWVEPGFGHAERAVSDELAERIARWVLAAVGSRRP